jgi:hypothetical protein
MLNLSLIADRLIALRVKENVMQHFQGVPVSPGLKLFQGAVEIWSVYRGIVCIKNVSSKYIGCVDDLY